MIHPSYVELMKVVNEDTALVGEEPVVNSRYSIVCATAKRARQIVAGDEPYIDNAEGKKPLSIAVEELYEGKLKILTADEVEEKDAELAAYKERKALEKKAMEEAEEEETEEA
ncbi:MAG: DNA-directed RNA polymerase subunit omega [Lachnospiraceae bacterium]|nr:DNA-directed RNA polymerase subunit omega [Lachnospiraceae bacterium]